MTHPIQEIHVIRHAEYGSHQNEPYVPNREIGLTQEGWDAAIAKGEQLKKTTGDNVTFFCSPRRRTMLTTLGMLHAYKPIDLKGKAYYKFSNPQLRQILKEHGVRVRPHFLDEDVKEAHAIPWLMRLCKSVGSRLKASGHLVLVTHGPNLSGFLRKFRPEKINDFRLVNLAHISFKLPEPTKVEKPVKEKPATHEETTTKKTVEKKPMAHGQENRDAPAKKRSWWDFLLGR